MKRLACLFLIPVIALSGCKMFGKDKDKKETDAAAKKPTKAELREENSDVDFQAFVSRLKKAVSGHRTPYDYRFFFVLLFVELLRTSDWAFGSGSHTMTVAPSPADASRSLVGLNATLLIATGWPVIRWTS